LLPLIFLKSLTRFSGFKLAIFLKEGYCFNSVKAVTENMFLKRVLNSKKADTRVVVIALF